MSRNQFLLILLSVIVASVMSGAISSWFFLSTKKTEEQVPAQIVRAQRFEVIDERGKTLGTFEADKKGAAVNLYDYAGKLRGELRYYSIDLMRGHSTLKFYGNDENPRIQLGVFQEEKPILTFYGGKNKILWEQKP
ncbi:MAG: hypothetical protein RW306_09380 [Geobacteraceae bacterium]|nr:hypothetical protein [Geobacteraceae bacterium]